MLNILPQLIANGLIIGAVYALVAAGFSLLFSTNRHLHFGHGAAITAGAYALYFTLTERRMPIPSAIIIALLAAVLVGWLCFVLVYHPLKKKHASAVVLLIAGIGLLIFFENLFVLLFGTDVKVVDYIAVTKGLTILGAVITKLQLFMIAVSLALLYGLFLFLYKNKYGITMRAIANNPELAVLIGIDKIKFYHLSFVIGSFLAGVAGILIALERNVEPIMGTGLMVEGFISAVIGGVTSVTGGILGGFILGIVENLGIGFLPSGFKGAIAFTLLFIFLIFKPVGLFGIRKGTRGD